MAPQATLRDVVPEDVDRIADWLQDEETAKTWFGYAGRDPLHRGYDPILMQMAAKSDWDATFRDDPLLLVVSIYNEDDDHIGECQVILDNEGGAYPSVLIGRKEHRRRGYAYAAMTSLVQRLFQRHGVDRIRADIPEDNAPALALFTKLGFLEEYGHGDLRPLVLDRSSLPEVDIFRALTPTQLESVESLGLCMQVPAGEVLGKAGEPADVLYVIVEGQAQLSAGSAVGSITVRVVGPGESFPLASLIGTRDLITSATAMTDMKVVAIPSGRLLRLCSEDPSVGMAVYSTIAEVLGARYRRTLDQLTTTAETVLRQADFFTNI